MQSSSDVVKRVKIEFSKNVIGVTIKGKCQSTSDSFQKGFSFQKYSRPFFVRSPRSLNLTQLFFKGKRNNFLLYPSFYISHWIGKKIGFHTKTTVTGCWHLRHLIYPAKTTAPPFDISWSWSTYSREPRGCDKMMHKTCMYISSVVTCKSSLKKSF